MFFGISLLPIRFPIDDLGNDIPIPVIPAICQRESSVILNKISRNCNYV
jgi:hypothetical protein